MTTHEPKNIEPASTMTGKELLEMFTKKYTEDLNEKTPAFIESLMEVFDEAFDEGYRLGWEEGHDAAVVEQRTKEASVSGWIQGSIEDL